MQTTSEFFRLRSEIVHSSDPSLETAECQQGSSSTEFRPFGWRGRPSEATLSMYRLETARNLASRTKPLSRRALTKDLTALASYAGRGAFGRALFRAEMVTFSCSESSSGLCCSQQASFRLEMYFPRVSPFQKCAAKAAKSC